jgi:hypothetical protein
MTSYGFAGTAGRVARLCPVPKCDTGAKLGVLIIHGVGSQEDCFAQPMIDHLKEKLSESDRTKICWKPVWWAHLLDRKEDILLRELFPEGDSNSWFDWFKLRAFVMNYVGDLIAYRYLPNISDPTKERNEIYEVIHEIVHDSIVEIKNELRSEDTPIIVMAHSLGSVIMFDYIRDRQNNKNATGYGATPFERMETLAGFITFGSPIPLFTLAYDTVPCINFPPDNLQKDLKDKAKWLNFYDHDDVFGWPLKYLSKRCEACVIEDKPVNVGDIFTFWDPLCHSKYWTDNDCTKPVAKYISEILKVCP